MPTSDTDTATRAPYTLATMGSIEELSERVRFALNCLKHESWLPFAVQAALLDGFARIAQLDKRDYLSFNKAADIVHNIAVACFAYNDLTLKSKTLRKIRALDMELSQEHYSTGFNRREAMRKSFNDHSLPTSA